MEDKVKSKKTALYTSLEILLILIMTIVGNMWDWVNMTFRPEAVATGAFWQSVIIKATLYSCSLVLAIILKMQKLELKDLRYDSLYEDYRLELVFKNEHRDQFTDYVDSELNPRIKKEYLRTKLNTKLAKIQKHERDSWVQDYFNCKQCSDYKQFEFSGWFKGYFSKKYFLKRTRIEEMLKDDFIEANWQYMAVKYPKISATSFGYYLDIRRNRDTKYKVNNEAAKDISRKGTLKVAQTILMSIILTVFALQPQVNELLDQANGWVVLLIEYIIRVFMVIMSFVMGIWTAKRVFSDNFLLPLTNRIDILQDFKGWADKHPVKELGVDAVREQVRQELEESYKKQLEETKKAVTLEAEKIIAEYKHKVDKQEGAII